MHHMIITADGTHTVLLSGDHSWLARVLHAVPRAYRLDLARELVARAFAFHRMAPVGFNGAVSPRGLGIPAVCVSLPERDCDLSTRDGLLSLAVAVQALDEVVSAIEDARCAA